jgi:VanZ family protein
MLFFTILSVLLVFLLLSAPVHMFPYELTVLSKNYSWTDKVIHVFIFSYLYVVIFVTFQVKKRYIFTATILLALMSEIVQSFTDSRSASVGDIVADIIGIIMGVVFISIYLHKNHINHNIID